MGFFRTSVTNPREPSHTASLFLLVLQIRKVSTSLRASKGINCFCSKSTFIHLSLLKTQMSIRYLSDTFGGYPILSPNLFSELFVRVRRKGSVKSDHRLYPNPARFFLISASKVALSANCSDSRLVRRSIFSAKGSLSSSSSGAPT
jgi:hypothetical protein